MQDKLRFARIDPFLNEISKRIYQADYDHDGRRRVHIDPYSVQNEQYCQENWLAPRTGPNAKQDIQRSQNENVAEDLRTRREVPDTHISSDAGQK
jgi:hypothetical protein